jgi:hypothetical protein
VILTFKPSLSLNTAGIERRRQSNTDTPRALVVTHAVDIGPWANCGNLQARHHAGGLRDPVCSSRGELVTRSVSRCARDAQILQVAYGGGASRVTVDGLERGKGCPRSERHPGAACVVGIG